MTSLRKLDRQLRRWDRYERKVYRPGLGTYHRAYAKLIGRSLHALSRRSRADAGHHARHTPGDTQ